MNKLFFLIILLFLNFISVEAAQLSPSEATDVSIIVDNDYPVINIINAQNQTYTDSLVVNFTIFELTLNSAWYSLNEKENITINSSSYSVLSEVDKTITGLLYLTLSAGNHILEIYANDSRNRVNSSRLYFSIISSCVGNSCNNDGGSGGGGDSGGGSSIESRNITTDSEKEEEKSELEIPQNESEEELPYSDKKNNWIIMLLILIAVIIVIKYKIKSSSKHMKKK